MALLVRPCISCGVAEVAACYMFHTFSTRSSEGASRAGSTAEGQCGMLAPQF